MDKISLTNSMGFKQGMKGRLPVLPHIFMTNLGLTHCLCREREEYKLALFGPIVSDWFPHIYRDSCTQLIYTHFYTGPDIRFDAGLGYQNVRISLIGLF